MDAPSLFFTKTEAKPTRNTTIPDNIRLYLNKIKENSNNADAYHMLGLNYTALCQYNDAVSALHRAITISPNVMAYHISLAKAYLAAREPEEAIITLKNSLKLNAYYAEVYACLAQAYLQRGQLRWAERNCRKALSLIPTHATAHYYMGIIHIERDKPEKALLSFKQSLAASPEQPDVRMALGRTLHKLGQYAVAMTQLQQALDAMPHDAYGLSSLAECQVMMGMPQEAIISYRKLLLLQPHNPEAHYRIAELLREEGALEEALRHYNQAIELEPANAGNYAMKAFLLIEMHEPDKAEQVLEQASLSGIQEKELLFPHALLKKYAGKLDEARQYLETVLQAHISPEKKALFQHHLAQVLEQQQEYDNAFDMYQASKTSFLKSAYMRERNPDATQVVIDLFREWVTKEKAAGWEKMSFDHMRSPVFIMGFPRSGIKHMEQLLARHSSIVSTRGATVINDMFLNMGRITGHPVHYPQAVADLKMEDILLLRNYYYDRIKKLCGDHALRHQIVDTLPLNMVYLPLIHRIFSEAPIMVMMRDPRDTVLSCFTHLFPAETTSMNFVTLANATQFYCRVMELYQHYKQSLSLNLIEIRYEDLVTATETTLQRGIEAIGLPWESTILTNYHPKPLPYQVQISNNDVEQYGLSGSIGRWRHYGRQFMPLLSSLEGFA